MDLLADEDLPDLPPKLLHPLCERHEDVSHNVLGFLMEMDSTHRWL